MQKSDLLTINASPAQYRRWLRKQSILSERTVGPRQSLARMGSVTTEQNYHGEPLLRHPHDRERVSESSSEVLCNTKKPLRDIGFHRNVKILYYICDSASTDRTGFAFTNYAG